jgi:hypothetical protein
MPLPYVVVGVFLVVIGLAAGYRYTPERRSRFGGLVLIAAVVVILIAVFAAMLVMAFLGVVALARLRHF